MAAILADMSVRTIRRTEVTVERERRIEVSVPRTCAVCASPMLAPDVVAAIRRALERGELHVTVCLHSAELHLKENR